MSQPFNLDQLRIAKPCTASWREMQGDDQRRFCAQCKKNVYNVAGMTEQQVRDLISKSEVLPCLRLSKRTDGTIITGDCPVGVATFWKKSALATLGALAFGATLIGSAFARTEKTISRETVADVLRDKPIVGPVVDKVCPSPAIMGEIAMPLSPPPSSGP
jgi:hypothetical protein